MWVRRDGGGTLVSVRTSLQQSTFKYTATDCNIYIHSSSDPIHHEPKLLPGCYGYWIGCFHGYAHRKIGWPDIDITIVAGYYTFQPALKDIQSERGSSQGYVVVLRFSCRLYFIVRLHCYRAQSTDMGLLKRPKARTATHKYQRGFSSSATHVRE